ncbi:NAD(P)/FAD-dependent oxidoreductase [Roseococcus suduntuyensis]|uniref:Glycine/D-amino acid oxidase-like deaminating enzyme n=1 Tax=Roseococcus suduntuyensis TaxID=455361 RepID=A0A840A9E5_9PROT|nr:FAD-binding oxidoreductase [Roseococcus suduntuyensis]MBB3897821.1 glycine/D-amino acid oxidase-like deaminating enzyme [Roseococcus suduntuyensis]
MKAQNSLWEATAEPAPDLVPLEGAAEAEVAIVGAGFSGLSTALALAERGVSVTVLEAVAPGAAASGANGGQVIPGLRHFVADLIAEYGDTLGRRLHEHGGRDADATFALIERHGIACEATRNGWLQVADSVTELAACQHRARAWAEWGAPARPLDAEEVRAITGAEGYLGGWMDMRGGTVQPLSLARGLARAALAAGARIHAPARVTTIRPDGRDWRLETAMGHLRARRVLLATNATGGALWPGLASTMIPVWSFQTATAPLPVGSHVLPGHEAVSDTRRVLRYWRRDAAGRLVVGGKGTLRAPRGPHSFGVPERMRARLYPALPDVPPQHWWGGQVAVTLDRLPRLFALADGVFATVQCNGKGVGWCTASGPAFADLLTGADARDLPLPPVTPLRPIPLHPLRTLYAMAGSLWFRARDALDRARPTP